MKYELHILLNKYFEGSLVEDDRQRIAVLMRDPDNQIYLSALLDEQLNDDTRQLTNDSAAGKRILGELMKHIKTEQSISAPPVHRIHFIKTTWFRYAAAIILVFGAAAYFWTATKKTEQTLANNNKQLPTDVAPGRDRAILTLANGQQILLDSAQGNIVKGGNLTVVNDHGKLDYEGVGTAVEFHTLSTPKGGQYKVILPDGTNVWLNAASSITYPTAFNGKDRTVAITGEAYFEVVKNVKAVFNVTVNNQQTIEVLGTSFNVNAYENENLIKTTLIDGSVKIGARRTSVLLKPRQQAVVENNRYAQNDNKADIKVQPADIEQAIAWKNGFFNFNNADLKMLMRQFSRWYDIDVKYSGNVPERSFKGELPRDLNLSQVMAGLDEMQVKFRIEGRTLTILGD